MKIFIEGFLSYCFFILANSNIVFSSVLLGLGDGEGATEMTESINMIREFCDRLLAPEKARTTRIVCVLLLISVMLSK